MRPESVRDLLQEQPFQPIRIHLSNGQSFDVRHPEMALLLRDSLIVADPAPDLSPGIFDRVHYVTLLHINNVEPISLSTSPGTNGAGS